jgi:hypothetical protein
MAAADLALALPRHFWASCGPTVVVCHIDLEGFCVRVRWRLPAGFLRGRIEVVREILGVGVANLPTRGETCLYLLSVSTFFRQALQLQNRSPGGQHSHTMVNDNQEVLRNSSTSSTREKWERKRACGSTAGSDARSLQTAQTNQHPMRFSVSAWVRNPSIAFDLSRRSPLFSHSPSNNTLNPNRLCCPSCSKYVCQPSSFCRR